MGYAPSTAVEGPDRLPLPYGLFSVVPLAETATERWQSGVAWTSPSCDPAGGIGEPGCQDETNPSVPTVPTNTVAEGLPKEFAGPSGGEASPFTVYGSYVCSPSPSDDANELAREHLLAREEARVEQALWTGDLGNVPNMAGANGAPDPVILGSTESDPAYTAKRALVLVEDFLAANYGSLGIIHMSRGTAVALTDEGMIESKGNRLQTKVGTPVVAGSGYSGDRIVGTPMMFGYRSDVFDSTNRPGDLLNRATNDLYAVAERNYLLGWDDCGVGVALLSDVAGGTTTVAAPVISYPVDGATVPQVHDVLGYAQPGQAVNLWSAANDQTMRVHATVTADEKGHFAFVGELPSGPDGTLAHFQVTTATGSSEEVTATVDTALEATPPAITYPSEGGTVPPIHDVTGTALPSQEVKLYSAVNTGTMRWNATTYADDTGAFTFSGDQKSGNPGQEVHFQVVTNEGESATVTATISDEVEAA